ncbi:uncharacterized [Tachysurus ichikawai]
MFKAHLSTCQDVPRQFDLGKIALADGFEQPVVADMWLLVGARGDGVAASCPGAAGSCGTIVSPISVRGVLETKSQLTDTVHESPKKKSHNTQPYTVQHG